MDVGYYRVDDVARILQVGKSTAYLIIRKINKKRKAAGKITVPGRVSKRAFEEEMG